MAERLPLEPLAARRVPVDAARDQLVQLGALEPAEVAIVDETTALRAEEARQRSFELDVDTLRPPIRNHPA